MKHWFVYYKLEDAVAHDLDARLRRMQHEVAAASGVRARLMRRADGDGGLATLLEVYDGIAEPAEFESTLATAVARAGLPPSLLAQRRTERFEDF
jgi:hypothetical protein